jgi:hypothetical protein
MINDACNQIDCISTDNLSIIQVVDECNYKIIIYFIFYIILKFCFKLIMMKTILILLKIHK